MGYQPGPLILQSAGNVGVETSDYKFAADAHAQLNDLDVLPGSWEPFLQDAAILMAESSNPFPDVAIDGLVLELHEYSDPAVLLGSDALLQSYGDAAIQLGDAIAWSPAEAWNDASVPFVAPGPAEQLGVPTIPPGWLSVAVQGTVGGDPFASIGTGGGAGSGGQGSIAPITPPPAPVAPPQDNTPIGGLRGR